MTPSEVKTLGVAPYIPAKKMGSESVTRKASFKCSVPNKVTPQRIARKVVLPMSTVQALTCKFNELSQINQTQKTKISQSAVKNMLGVGGKQNTIKVVICRKPSATKYKKPDDIALRRRVNVRKFQLPETKENKTVLQKITEYEGLKTDSNDMAADDKRSAKMLVPKILVDIDLKSDCSVISGEKISVKNAINLFEKNAEKTVDVCAKRTVECQETKPKPIAAIKPILKKPETRITKLSPKDSLNRKKYIAMKREFAKERSDEDGGAVSDNQNKTQRLNNNSSLHKQILQSMTVAEIPVEDKTTGNVSQNLKPNTSFLWSKKEDEKRLRVEIPLPVPPDTVPDTIYDDVRPISEESEDEKIDTDEETYDDVGVYWRTNESNKKIRESILEKNILNEISNQALYDNPKKNIYDDGEGERYQYISDITETIQPITKQTELELYQYIQNNNNNNHNDNNIYEDIQSIKAAVGKDEPKDIYEDICVDTSPENCSLINCYESVYNNIYSNNNGCEGYIKSDTSDTSNNSGKSTYEKSNSLYGISAGNIIDSGQCLNSSNSPKSSTYHLYSPGYPNSETSQSNSDEWVEVSDTESEGTIYLVHERPKKVKTGGNSWTQKEKRRWKKLQKKSHLNGDISTWSGSSGDSWIKKRPNIGDVIFISSHSVIYLGDFENKIINLHAYDFENDSEKLKILFTIPRPVLRKKFKPSPSVRAILYKTDSRECQEITLFLEEDLKLQNSDDHFYESVGQCENPETVLEENNQTHPQDHRIVKDEYPNDEPYVDDFDSQSSEDEAFVDAKLPDVPNHGYNITKSLKAAGQKLRKNFSLRKSDFSKSLKRFKKSRPKLTEAIFTENGDVDNMSKAESPSTPTNIYNNSDSSSGSYNVTSSDVKSHRHRKSWTFRSKFKQSSSVDSDNADSNRNSTFYLSLSDIQPKKKDELLNEIQTVLEHRNNSSESVSEKAEIRHDSTNVAKSRPNVPPPPPPVKFETDKTKYSDLLWGEKASNSLYVESGLFDKQKKHSRCGDSDSSLYAEIGLYAASDVTSNRKNQMFTDEPLYQFYTECVNQRARDDILNNYDSEGYEEINDFYSVINEKRRTIDIKNVRPNFEDFNDDVRPKIASVRSISDRRTLWCQIPAVLDSCILETLTDQGRKLQEAKFEIVTSEASYMNSLNVLESHFMKKVADLNMISKRDYRILFSNIVAVKKCSETFLEDLEKCWQNNIMLTGICDIVYKHATSSFQVYTKYCKNQVCIYRTLRELIDKNSNFETALKEIENDPICQNLNIHSFLMLPMQRITRLPLLLGAVLARLDKTDDEYDLCKASFDVLNKIVQDCDDEARRMEKCEEMLILSQQIEFPKDIRRIPIITGSRLLVKSGQVTQLVNRDENKLTFGKKFSKVSLTLFLFTDLLIVAKKKNIRNYVVVDHCPRNLVQMQTTEGLMQLPVKFNSDMGGKLLMLLTMLENHEKKTVEMILSFEMESDRQRWLEAVTPKLSENPDECIYEEWDCPQVISLYEFTPAQPDELNLCIGDVVNVLKKMNDGWYQGERLRDGARGWFPQNHTQEISSSHVRAKNKKLRYKLLALSGNLIDSQKQNGK